jgi:multidrug resistance efflux pump
MDNEPKQPRQTSFRNEMPVVPAPVGTHLREFRVKYLPVLVFGSTLLLIFQLWKQVPPSTGLRGVGEGSVSTLASPQDGFIKEVAVAPRGWIEAGQPLMTIVPFDPRSRLDVLQSQLQLSRLTLEPSVADRNAINYERLRVDSLRLKQELAMAKANLNRAEKTLPRHEALMKERLLSEDLYELTVRDRDFYRAEVEEKTKAIVEIERGLDQLRGMSEPLRPGENSLAQELIPKLQEQVTAMETNWAPMTLVAPISGEVSFYRQSGEFVRAGEILLIINAPQANHVVAYLKNPLPFEPEIGMPMEIITRRGKPQRFFTEISRIGARVEVITNALAYIPAGALVDVGLPLVLPVPENVPLRPGEIVDVDWRPTGTNLSFLQRLFRGAPLATPEK